MSVIFDSIKTRNLDQVFEINLHQYFLHIVSNNLENTKVDDGSFAVRIASGIKLPHLNAVLQTDITDNFDLIYEKSLEFFDKNNVPFTWFIIPSHKPENLQDLLKSKGLRTIAEDIVVGVELDSIIRNISTPNSLYIEIINSFEKLEIWTEIYCKVRNIRGESVEEYKKIFRDYKFGSKNPKWQKYLGWLNGEPVAASTLIFGGGVVVAYDESVLPKYRQWGVGDAINLVPLKLARKTGHNVALIPTSVGNMKRYTGIGFKKLFSLKKMVYLDKRNERRRR